MTDLARPRRFLGRPDGVGPGHVPEMPIGERPVLRGGERSGRLWVLQAVTGALLVGFLGVHLVAQHLIVPGGLRTYEDVVAYLRQPLPMAADLGLLASVLAHSVLGLRSTLVEVVGPATLRRLSLVLVALGLAAFAYGVWLTAAVAGW